MIKNFIFKNFKFVIIFFFITFNLQSTEIATININNILEKSISYNNFLNELNKKKTKFENKISLKENDLNLLNLEIQDSELIINQNELDILISKYNKEVQNLENEIKQINLFFSKNIEINKNKIINQIISFIGEISKSVKFDIILTEDQYFMSSKNIDISDRVIEIINKNLIELEIIDETNISN